MTSSSGRFYLEELSVDKHLDAVYDLWSTPENLEGSGLPVIHSRADNEAWLRKRTRESNPDIENFAIMAPLGSPLYPTPNPVGELKSPSSPSSPSQGSQQLAVMIGAVGILRTAPPELGYIISRGCWGRGVASEAVAVCMALYWQRTDASKVPKVYAFVNTSHPASQRVLARNGFRPDMKGTVPSGGRLPSGEVTDEEVQCWTLDRPG